MRGPSSLLALLLVAGTIAGCSLVESPDSDDASGSAISGEALFERLIAFENELDQPLQNPFFGGVGFEGKAATSEHLVIFLLDADRRDAARAALKGVLEGGEAEDVSIQIWEEEETIASEAMKRALPVFEAAESVTFLDYDERIDRLSVGLRNLEDVREIERLLAERKIPREAVVTKPEYYAVPYGERGNESSQAGR